jgi:hypothetical protein
MDVFLDEMLSQCEKLKPDEVVSLAQVQTFVELTLGRECEVSIRIGRSVDPRL